MDKKQNKLGPVEHKRNLINDLIFFSVKLDELWEYHPDNLEGLNLIKEYEHLQEKVYKIEEEINQLN